MKAESSGQADAEATEPNAEIVDLPRINGSPGDSAVDRVTAWVRRSVLNGTMAPGSSFSITDLSERLGVSAIPVREALRRLDAQGLILLRPGRSAIVNPLDVTELRGIYRLRRGIEPDLAARACNLLGSSDRDHLDSLLEAYRQPGNDAEELWRIHHDLHLALLQPAASAWDLRILSQLWHAGDRYTRIVFETYNVSDTERKRRYDAHRVLIEASRSGSPFEIRTALTSHLLDNEAACLVGIASLNPPP
jgi:DNA-binding GntR family transcriptional regulator